MATTATTTGFGVELDLDDLDFETAEVREREDREQDAALDAAREHFDVVNFLADAGLAPVPSVSQIDCMRQPAITHQWLTQQKSGWRMEAGTLLVIDENTHGNPLRPLWLLGHAWLWNEEREVLLDVTESGWVPRLKETDMDIQRPECLGVSTIVRDECRAQAAVLPHLSKMEFFLELYDCSLLYVPGVAPVDALKVLESDPDYVKEVELQFDLCGEHWRQLIATTREGRCCAEQARGFLGG